MLFEYRDFDSAREENIESIIHCYIYIVFQSIIDGKRPVYALARPGLRTCLTARMHSTACSAPLCAPFT